jgi:hypothetical protein
MLAIVDRRGQGLAQAIEFAADGRRPGAPVRACGEAVNT